MLDRCIAMRFALGFLAAIATLMIAASLVIWTGAYNVAATVGHTDLGRWILDTALHNSVEARADDVRVDFRNADLRSGFREFQEYCVHCHGAPGVKPHEWTTGMVPNPPELSRAAAEWTPQQVFWIAKHGIKMTGMPAFGDTESDETIRNIAAFVKHIEGMSPQQYAQLRQQWGASGGHQSQGHSHGPDAH